MPAFAFALLLATTASPFALAKAPSIAAAAAAKDRAADHVALDTARKPAEILRFMQLKPGMTALDFLASAIDDLSKNVFDSAIRGKIDRFAFRFRTPK